MKVLPSKEKLEEYFEYDGESGNLIWRPQPREKFGSLAAYNSFNSRCLGMAAGWLHPTGYRIIRLGRVGYLGHRLVWAFHHGDDFNMKGLLIDHIDHNRSNNRIENLRVVSSNENQKNKRLTSGNKHGVLGVRFMPRQKKWRAYIGGGANAKYLGEFQEFEDAVKIRKAAEVRFGYHENHGANAAGYPMGR